MRLLGESSQAEMVAEFLRAEYESSMLDHVRQLVAMNYLPQRFITHPDTSNPSENKAREGALMAYRGNFFRGFPATQVRWFHAAIDRADLAARLLSIGCLIAGRAIHTAGPNTWESRAADEAIRSQGVQAGPHASESRHATSRLRRPGRLNTRG